MTAIETDTLIAVDAAAQQAGNAYPTLHAVRQFLSPYSRAQQDAAIRSLRLADKLTCEAATGYIKHDQDVRDAGIQEHQLLVYIARC